jgi:outer membrane protein OmpA-like peptidoglycan-associated protein
MEVITEAAAMEKIDKAEAERQRVLLQARTVEAERAKSLAEQRARQASQSEQEAQRALAVADAAIDEAKRLADELSEMEAEETERGLVLTLGDVLFDTNRAEIKSGASRTMDRLAEYLDNNPERRLLIEGHTDSRGSSEYNEDLSARRADAVVEALVERGIDQDRLRSEGLGESFPVASNDTDAGMQQNRRVEIVVSDRNGEFVSASNRAGVTP